MTAFTLRPTRIDDVAALPAIERAAGQRFRDVPELARLADNEVICVEDHLGYAGRGLSWLTTGLWALFSPKLIHRRCLLWNCRFTRLAGTRSRTPVNRPCRRACPQSGAELADVNDVS